MLDQIFIDKIRAQVKLAFQSFEVVKRLFVTREFAETNSEVMYTYVSYILLLWI